MVAATTYPGSRRTHGGGISFADLLRGVAAPLVFEASFPRMADNAGDASGFFPFALAALPLLFICLKDHWQNLKLIIPTCLLLCFLAIFSLFPMPHWLASVTELSLTTTERWILPIGLAGIFISVLFLPEVAKLPLKFRLLAWLIAMVFVIGWMADAREVNAPFLTAARMAILAGTAAVLFASYLTGWTPLFLACSLCILAPAALTVNPVTQGLSPLLDTPAAIAVRAIAKSNPGAGWVAYESNYLSQFLMAQGVPVISGAKTVPDLRFFDTIDPERKSLGIYNRYGIAVYQPPATRGTISFKLINFCGYEIIIDPANAALRREGVQFYVFPLAVDFPGIQLVKALPQARIWIYRAL